MAAGKTAKETLQIGEIINKVITSITILDFIMALPNLQVSYIIQELMNSCFKYSPVLIASVCS
jgi:hypothetical protein